MAYMWKGAGGFETEEETRGRKDEIKGIGDVSSRVTEIKGVKWRGSVTYLQVAI
jgi:hypothetical protein